MKNPTAAKSRPASRQTDAVLPLPPRRTGAQILRPTPLDGVLGRLSALRAGLSPTARRIAEFVLANASDVVDMSVTEVAERTHSSEGSVVGLCQQLGARGFQQLKIALARDLVQPVQFIHEDLSRDDTTATVLEKIFASGIQALQDTRKVLDAAQMARAVNAIRKSQRVEVYGIGSAAPIAEDANYRLMRIGIETKVVVDSHVQAISASLTGPRVVTITISHSGSTIETVTATRLAKKAGATTICITNYGKSPILTHADIVLHTMAKETRFRTEAMTSRIAQLAIVDALIASLALATYDRAVDTIAKTFDVLSTKRF
jgi:RpiR family transcriptional regulator, carbohydrate utilization regulator